MYVLNHKSYCVCYVGNCVINCLLLGKIVFLTPFSSTGTTWMTLWGRMCLCVTSQRLLHVPVSTSHQESWIYHYQNHQRGSASSVCLRKTFRMYASGYLGFTRGQRWGTHLQSHTLWCWGSVVFWLTTMVELTHSYVSVTSENLGTPVGKSFELYASSCNWWDYCVCPFCLCLHSMTLLPLNGLLWNLIL